MVNCSKRAKEVLVKVFDVKVGDVITVRTGNLIPLDGRVVRGEAMVNQSTMTGEGLPVLKKRRGYVYAGTVVEEGDLYIKVDKAAFIRKERAAGHKVIMIGDGVNDSPALSEADCGIAINSGAAIAREVADITIAADDLYSLVRLRALSRALMKRIGSNYRFIMGFNMGLIALGFTGILLPANSALLHNASTIAIGLRSMTDLHFMTDPGV